VTSPHAARERSEDGGEQQDWLAPDTICKYTYRNGTDECPNSRHSAENTDEIGMIAQAMYIVIER